MIQNGFRPIFFILSFFSLFHFQVNAETVSDAIEACTKEKNSLKRLVCFDGVAKNLRSYSKGDDLYQPSQSGTARTLSSPAVSTAADTNDVSARINQKKVEEKLKKNNEVDEFGKKSLPKEEAYIEEGNLIAEVKQVEKLRSNKSRITLTNGQIWQQTDSLKYGVPKAGDKVILEKGLLNSFFIKVEGSKKRIRVKRVD